MTKQLLIIFLFLRACSVQAQQQGQGLIDSLNAQLPSMKDDSEKVKTYNKISQLYYSVNPAMSIPFAEKGLMLAEKISWKRGMANLHNNLGLFISDTGNYQAGNDHYLESYRLNKELDSKSNQINNLNNLGRNYQFTSDFTKAADYFFQALAVAEALKSDNHISLVGTNLSSCFFRQQNYPKATQYALLTLKHARTANNALNEITALSQLGTVKLATSDTPSAKRYLDSALKVCERTNNMPDMAKVLVNIAVTLYPDYQRAIGVMQRVDSIITIINPGSETEIVNSFNLAEAYHHLAQQNTGREKKSYLQKAATWLSKASAIAGTGRPEMTINILLLQGDINEAQGNYKLALKNFKRSSSISDSIFSQGKKNDIAELEGKHNLAIKDNEIAINRLMLANQHKKLWGLIAGLTLFGGIVALLFYQARVRRRVNTTLMGLNHKLDEANKVKARFFGILSHDLRSPIVNLVHFLEIQRDSPDLMNEKQKQKYNQTITESAEILLGTMEAMLLWSKEQMENFKPNIRSVEIAHLFENLSKSFKYNEDIRIDFVAASGLAVATDENYLSTIMQNLTSNAVRALKSTPNAHITWEAKPGPDNEVLLSITDNGPGIEAEQARTLFDDSAVVNEKTGLGFHLIRDLAKAINYKIQVQSQPGQGSTFILQG